MQIGIRIIFVVLVVLSCFFLVVVGSCAAVGGLSRVSALHVLAKHEVLPEVVIEIISLVLRRRLVLTELVLGGVHLDLHGLLTGCRVPNKVLLELGRSLWTSWLLWRRWLLCWLCDRSLRLGLLRLLCLLPCRWWCWCWLWWCWLCWCWCWLGIRSRFILFSLFGLSLGSIAGFKHLAHHEDGLIGLEFFALALSLFYRRLFSNRCGWSLRTSHLRRSRWLGLFLLGWGRWHGICLRGSFSLFRRNAMLVGRRIRDVLLAWMIFRWSWFVCGLVGRWLLRIILLRRCGWLRVVLLGWLRIVLLGRRRRLRVVLFRRSRWLIILGRSGWLRVVLLGWLR